MPVQHTLFGRPIPRLSPRRMFALLSTIATFALIVLVFTLPNSIPLGPSLSKFTDKGFTIPKLPTKLPSASILNPFRPVAHAPPPQKNSTSGEASWYSNWNWLSPFSSSVTLDENRSLLPPLADRPAIYTYYDHTLKKEEDVKQAENDLLVTWRRAWWAQGFKPVILGPAEAMNNPLFDELQRLDLEPSLVTELSRWLAWETMGTGMLSNYLTLPMGPREDALLSFLRRGEYPQLTRYEGLGSGLFVGPKTEVTAAVKAALENPELKRSKDFISAVAPSTFKVDPNHDAIAFYDAETINSKYAKLTSDVLQTGPGLLRALNQLINAHLLNTWQNNFSKGIAVLKPIKDHTTVMIDPALELAHVLSQCAESPMPSTCPPNRPKCKPCVASLPMKVTTPPFFRNDSAIYTIGVVPHPYTLATVSALRETIDIPYIRRDSPRDPWLFAATKELMGTGLSGAPRVVKFKEAVASDYGASRSLWLTAEKSMPNDLDWHFGFEIPSNSTDDGKSETPVPGPERRPPPPKPDPKAGPPPTEAERKAEEDFLVKAKMFVKGKAADAESIKEAIEAWNLADTEAWRFARAYLARSRVERLKWEKEEKKFAGGAGAERGSSQGWARWFDSPRDDE